MVLHHGVVTFFALQYHDATQRTAPIDWYEVMFLLFSSNI